MRFIFILSGLLLLLTIGWTAANEPFRPKPATKAPIKFTSVLTTEARLGKKIFFDAGFSNPAGQACASCHAPANAFADPKNRCVSTGAFSGRFGSRNAPAIAYAVFTPPLQYNTQDQTYTGGLFWDGRASTLTEQALGPLFNHLEMNTDKDLVTKRLRQSYTSEFTALYGPAALKDPETACKNLARVVAAFEKSNEVSPFTSKYDYYLKGQATLTKEELQGLQLFNDPKKGNCAACHPAQPDPDTKVALFTDFSYDNIGLPANAEIKALWKEKYQPDLGLGAIVKKASENGKFRVPTLRNVAVTAPYFHNGVFKTLAETVAFYNHRDSGKFGAPEINATVNKEELGNLKLNTQEEKAIVAFMNTLTDGYQQEQKPKKAPGTFSAFLPTVFGWQQNVIP